MIIYKKQIQSKQSGMTAIMLAMFLAIVVSLLAVGFATLVRKDQAETLDKTLSYQAQYAAESGVNKAIAFIDANPGVGDSSSNCTDPVNYNGNRFDKGFKVGEADVTCAVWTYGGESIELQPSQDDPKFGSFKGVRMIEISWASDAYSGITKPNPSLPSLDSKPVLGFTITVKDTSGLYSTGVKRFYIVPSDNNGCGNETYTASSGSVFCAKVDVATRIAKVTIQGLDDTQEYAININPINGSDAIPVTIKNGTGAGTFVNTSQYKIDVNAKAQDITKRVVVYYNPSGTPGKPYVVNIPSNGTICKDYRVDGTQNESISDGEACPSPPTP